MGGKREQDDPAESLDYSRSHVGESGVGASPFDGSISPLEM